MYFRTRYDADTSEIEKFNYTLNIEKDNILINNVHKSLCAHFMKVQETKYDISVTYDLSNHLKVPTMKINNQSTSSNGYSHAWFSVFSVLLTSVKLRMYNCSHRHHYESVVHSESIIDIIFPKKKFIVLHRALVHYENSSWFIENGYYHTNKQGYSFQLWKMITLLKMKKRK